jgi:hypothetical protein
MLPKHLPKVHPLVSSLVTSTRKLSPLFSPQRHRPPSTRSHNRDTPCKAHHPSCTTGENVHPWTQEIQQIIGNACPLIDSAPPTYKRPLRPPQMAGLPCLRLIHCTPVLTVFPTITYSYRPKWCRFRAHLPQICSLHYRCTRNAWP